MLCAEGSKRQALVLSPWSARPLRRGRRIRRAHWRPADESPPGVVTDEQIYMVIISTFGSIYGDRTGTRTGPPR
jgi:hypothetical protein